MEHCDAVERLERKVAEANATCNLGLKQQTQLEVDAEFGKGNISEEVRNRLFWALQSNGCGG